MGTYIDIGDAMKQRLDIQGDHVMTADKVKLFAIFRTMIYCDEMHDFGAEHSQGNERSLISKIRSAICWRDIVWYTNEVAQAVHGESASDEHTVRLLQPFFDLLKHHATRVAQQSGKIVENLDLFHGHKDEAVNNPLMGYLTQVEAYDSVKSRLGRGKYYIAGAYDDVAKNIASILLNVMDIKKSNIMQALGCAARGQRISSMMKIIQMICYGYGPSDGNWKHIPVEVTIDQEGADPKVPFYTELYESNFDSKCNIQFDNDVNSGDIKLFNTYATLMDPGSGKLERLRRDLKRELYEIPDVNEYQTIYFFDIPCIVYIYASAATDGEVDNNMTNTFYKIFSIEKRDTDKKLLPLGNPHTKAMSSQQVIVDEFMTGDHMDQEMLKYVLFYKTFGDLNQVIQFYDFTAVGDWKDKAIYIFMTGDLMTGMMSSLLSKNVVTETTKTSEIGDGMIIYLTAKERERARGYYDMFNQPGGQGIALLAAITEPMHQYEQQLEQTRQDVASSMLQLFGKKHISNKLKLMSTSDLKTKLKSVGIRVTKDIRGKRKELTRRELESKASFFKKLQLKAKTVGIKLMYKNKKKVYVYKAKTRLENEIKRQLERIKKMKKANKPRANKNKFG
jgi:hypothetical protein